MIVGVCDFELGSEGRIARSVGCDSLRLGVEVFSTAVVPGFEELIALGFEFLRHGLCVGEAFGFSC